MLEKITDLPAGVIGFEVSGKLTAEDYRDILLPAVNESAAAGDVRILLVIPAFHGLSGGAVWQDLKMGMEHWRSWKRIALVTDIDWMRHGTEWFAWMIPGEVKHFPASERDAAVEWVAA